MTIAHAAGAAIAASVLIVGVWAQAPQVPTFKRTVLQQGDISVPGHEAVTAGTKQVLPIPAQALATVRARQRAHCRRSSHVCAPALHRKT